MLNRMLTPNHSRTAELSGGSSALLGLETQMSLIGRMAPGEVTQLLQRLREISADARTRKDEDALKRCSNMIERLQRMVVRGGALEVKS